MIHHWSSDLRTKSTNFRAMKLDRRWTFGVEHCTVDAVQIRTDAFIVDLSFVYSPRHDVDLGCAAARSTGGHLNCSCRLGGTRQGRRASVEQRFRESFRGGCAECRDHRDLKKR